MDNDVSKALQDIANHGREYAHIRAADLGQFLAKDEQDAQTALVNSICDEFDALAAKARDGRVPISEFHRLLKSLSDVGHAPTGKHVEAAKAAFTIVGRQ